MVFNDGYKGTLCDNGNSIYEGRDNLLLLWSRYTLSCSFPADVVVARVVIPVRANLSCFRVRLRNFTRPKP